MLVIDGDRHQSKKKYLSGPKRYVAAAKIRVAVAVSAVIGELRHPVCSSEEAKSGVRRLFGVKSAVAKACLILGMAKPTCLYA